MKRLLDLCCTIKLSYFFMYFLFFANIPRIIWLVPIWIIAAHTPQYLSGSFQSFGDSVFYKALDLFQKEVPFYLIVLWCYSYGQGQPNNYLWILKIVSLT